MPKTVLFAWECGGGLGHLMQIRPIAMELRRHGARVVVAVRDVSRAGAVFAGSDITLLAAPFRLGLPTAPSPMPCSFAHVLHNVGWDSQAGLGGLADAWRATYELVRPDVIAFDHSPSALLAARGFAARRVVIGSGFCCPQDQAPFPNLRLWQAVDPAALAADEAATLSRANGVLAGRRWPPLQRLGQLYSEVDRTLLTTFAELDHYPDRPGDPRYYGSSATPPGKSPRWPGGSGKRVAAYLKPFAALPHLLIRLKGLGCPALIFADGIDPAIRSQFTGPTMRFETEWLDLPALSEGCDVAVLNATHGTTAAMLRAGKPMLLLPHFLEQQILAMRVREMGAAVDAPVDQPKAVVQGLERLLASDDLRNRALAFADRYRNFDPVRENEQMVAHIERLA